MATDTPAQYVLRIASPVMHQRGQGHMVLAADELVVRHVDRTKPVRTRVIGGVPFSEVRVVGTDTSRLRLFARAGAVFGNGTTTASGSRTEQTVPNTAAGVRSILRRLQPDDQAAINAADAELQQALRAVSDARYRRAQAVARAYQRGLAVQLAEVRALLPS